MSDRARLTTEEQAALDDVFSYHAPGETQIEDYKHIREAAKEFAATVITRVPSCADRTVALRHVRDAVMNANAAIALAGRGLR